MSYYGGIVHCGRNEFSGYACSVIQVEGAMSLGIRRHKHTETHWRNQVSVQVIERDRRAPECHTWAPGGQRRTGVGRAQPFTAQAFTMERNHQPGLAMPCQGLPTHSLLFVQSADCAVWKLCSYVCAVYVAVRVKKSMHARL